MSTNSSKHPQKQWGDLTPKERRDALVVLSIIGNIPLSILIGVGRAIFFTLTVWLFYAAYKVIIKKSSVIKKSALLLIIVLAFFTVGIATGVIESNTTDTYSEKSRVASDVKPAQIIEQNELSQEDSVQTNEPTEELYDVTSIVDGDTIKVSYEGKVESLRLIGIDTPETNHPSKPVECFGKDATAYITKLLDGKKVRLEKDPSQSSRDKYNRLLRFVFTEDGTHINEKMIRDGYAFEYTYNSNPYKYHTLFKEAQSDARNNNRGLWAASTCGGQQKPAQQPVVKKPNTIKPSTHVSKPAPSPTQSTGTVKKSKTGICHAPGTTYYARTKNYTGYPTVDACLKSGGRLPKR